MNISFVFLRKKLISCIKNYLSVLFIYSHLPSSSSNAALASCHPHVSPFLSSEVPLAASLDTVTPSLSVAVVMEMLQTSQGIS